MNQDQPRRWVEEATKVTLAEQLASVPETARLVIDDADGKGTRYIPIGSMCKEAVSVLTNMDEDKRQKDRWDDVSQEFRDWWNGDYDDSTNPFRLNSSAYWAWAGWNAALVKLMQKPLTAGDERRHVICLCPECTHPAPSQQEDRKPLPEPDMVMFDPSIMSTVSGYSQEKVHAIEKQWSERVAELERVLGVARDALVFAQKSHACIEIFDAIATIDAARSKEGGGV